jgi:hypothetical protein
MKLLRLRWRWLGLLSLFVLLLVYLFRAPLVVSIAHWAQKKEFEKAYSETGKIPLPPLSSSLRDRLLAWLKKHGKAPVQFIADSFDRHDLVLIGELHRVRWQVELIRKTLPRIQQKGVSVLAMEFLRADDQADLDRLLKRTDHYDEALATELFFRCDPGWAFQEYIDILKAAWELNRMLPKGSKPFRVLGLGNSKGRSEKPWAEVILREVVAKGEKALIYCGSHHAFTFFHRIYREGDGSLRRWEGRFGHYLYKALGSRVFTIHLHSGNEEPGEGALCYSADGIIDALLAELPPEKRSFGLALRSNPFGELVETRGNRAFKREKLQLQEIWDGYICNGTLSRYRSVRLAKSWFTEENIDRGLDILLARVGKKNWRWLGKLLGPDALTGLLGMDANIELRYLPFH